LLSSLTPARTWAQQLQCRPCSLHFGRVAVGTSSSVSIHLVNTGTKSLRITAKSKRGIEFQFGNFPLPVTIAPGKSIPLPIVFKPTAAGHVTGTFNVVSTALNKRLSMQVAGNGVSGPQLTVTPSTLSFGNVTLGKSATLAATLSAANGDVTISSDQLTSSEFSVVGLNLPLTIPAGQSIKAALKFTPNQSGTASGKIGYFSNATVSPAVEQLTGVGVTATAHSVSLTWQDSGSGIVGFNVYRGSTHGGPYRQINSALDASTDYTDYAVVAGATYYYVTTAIDGTGQQSAYSNETLATIPSP
jgi:hypothetical protein